MAQDRFLNMGQIGPLQVTQRNLPHWIAAGATYFVTYRLADSLPAEVLALRKVELRSSRGRPEEADMEGRQEALDRWLDAGRGRCLLRLSAVQDLVLENWLHFEGVRYQLDKFVIMPNHVHLIVKPLPGYSLSRICHGWKSFSGKAIARMTGEKPPIWMDESYDHIVRDEQELEHFRQYIAENPGLAGLKSGFWLGGGRGLD